MNIESSLGPKHFALRGEWVELCFMAKAAKNGIRAIKPWGDYCRYDFIVEVGGQFQRVQVKGTSQTRRNQYTCGLRAITKKPYTKADIDFFAIYLIQADEWYIIPLEAVNKDAFSISISTHNSLSRYGPYREAWHLLSGEQKQTQGPSTSLGMTDPLPNDNTKL